MRGFRPLPYLAPPCSSWPQFHCSFCLVMHALGEGKRSISREVVWKTDPLTSLLYVLGWGSYLSSLLKDYVCLPRPTSPPVTRLSEFGHLIHLILPLPAFQ